jgi:hypothetical protein
MDPKYFGLNETIGRTVKAPADQGRIVAIAVALAASAQAHLPSAQLENIPAFFAQQVLPVVSEKISEVNESVVFGAKSALEYTQVFWKMRYFAAWPAAYTQDSEYRLKYLLSQPAAKNMDITMLYSGGASQISDELSQFMNKYKVEIMLIASDVAMLLSPPAVPMGAQ